MATYLLRDLFTTDDPNPVANPRTAEPGPGTILPTGDATGNLRIITGRLVVNRPPAAVQAYNAQGWASGSSFSKAPGLMAYCIVKSSVPDRFVALNFIGQQALPNAAIGLLWNGNIGDNNNVYGSFTSGVDYQFAIVARGQSGYIYMIKGGTEYPAWTILAVTIGDFTHTLYAMANNFNADTSYDTVAVYQKDAPWDRDYGKTTLYAPLVENGYVGFGLADALNYVTWNPDVSEVLKFYFRYSDDSNHYRVECDAGAATYKIIKCQTGVDTVVLGPLAQNFFTDDRSYRIGAVAYGSTIAGYIDDSQGGASIQKGVITGQTFNQATAGVKVGGTAQYVSNLEVWPRTLAGTKRS
jgi:hypothetical protein